MTADWRFGTRGWQRLDAIYPARTRPSDQLSVYATHASVVEAENFFSGIPKPERVQALVEQSPDGFKFDVLAFGGLTLYQRRPGLSDLGTKSWKDVAVEPPDVLFEDYCASLEPLCTAGRLGAVILQFPPWFESGSAGREYLERIREQMPMIPLAAEFRHPTWTVPVNRDLTLETLIELEIGLIVADFPMGTDEWMPPIDTVTVDDVAVFRLHGQNVSGWARTLVSPVEPVSYTYSADEISLWVDRVRAVSREVDEVHLLMGTGPTDAALVAGRLLVEAVEAAEESESRWGYEPESIS